MPTLYKQRSDNPTLNVSCCLIGSFTAVGGTLLVLVISMWLHETFSGQRDVRVIGPWHELTSKSNAHNTFFESQQQQQPQQQPLVILSNPPPPAQPDSTTALNNSNKQQTLLTFPNISQTVIQLPPPSQVATTKGQYPNWQYDHLNFEAIIKASRDSLKKRPFTECEHNALGWPFAESWYRRVKWDVCVPPGNKKQNAKNSGWTHIVAYGNKRGQPQFFRIANLYASVSSATARNIDWHAHCTPVRGAFNAAQLTGLLAPVAISGQAPPANKNAGAVQVLASALLGQAKGKVDGIDNEVWYVGHGAISHNPWHSMADLLARFTLVRLFNDSPPAEHARIVPTRGNGHENSKVTPGEFMWALMETMFYRADEKPGPHFSAAKYQQEWQVPYGQEVRIGTVQSSVLNYHHTHIWQRRDRTCKQHKRSPMMYDWRDHLMRTLGSRAMREDFARDLWLERMLDMAKSGFEFANFDLEKFGLQSVPSEAQLNNLAFLRNATRKAEQWKRPASVAELGVVLKSGVNRAKPVLFFAKRWNADNSYCNHRCIKNYQEVKQAVANAFPHMFVVVGNPAQLSMLSQFLMLRSADVMFSMHGGVFALSVFMYEPQSMFEIRLPKWWGAEHLSNYLNVPWRQYLCPNCWHPTERNHINVVQLITTMRAFFDERKLVAG